MRDFARPGRSPVHAANGMAATSHPASTQVAVEMLRNGGNAVDAAVAAVAVQCVVDPMMTGIGGDGFVLYAPAGATIPVALNGSGRAPAALDAAWLRERGLAIQPTSPHAVTVPGAIALWDRLVADHGTRSLGELLQPAIRFAEEGYPVQSRVAWDWSRLLDRVTRDPAASRTFLLDGRAPTAGTIMRNPALGKTLRLIAERGRAGFYEGEVAADLVDRLRVDGGLHTLEDFATAEAEYVTPVTTRYRGYDVYECPPNGQGLGALMMLNVIGQFDLVGLPQADRLHVFAEACRQAYHHRDALFGDPAQVEVPVEYLLSDAWRDRAFAAIDLRRAGTPSVWSGPEHKDTVYLCVVDRDGNAISFINSLFEGFGSGIQGPQSGVLLHNRGLSFRTEAGHPNAVAPGKRPMHTIIPGMLMRDGKTVAPFGVMGGHYQSMGHVELLTGIIDRGLDVQEALDAPRSFGFGATLELEPGIPETDAADLAARGHRIVRTPSPLGGGQIVWIDREAGTLVGGSDPRKDGSALGW